MEGLPQPAAAVDPSLPSSRTSSCSMTPLSPSSFMFSRAHSIRSSVSSIPTPSSPLSAKDSFELYGTIKRLEDVTEEPTELDHEEEGAGFGHLGVPYASTPSHFSLSSPEYSLGDCDAWSTTSSGHHQFKRQRPETSKRNSITERMSSRFSTISRKWKAHAPSTPLSLITNSLPHSRPVASSRVVSPSFSVSSKDDMQLASSPALANMDETLRASASHSLHGNVSAQDEEPEQTQATTPLLPPTVAELSTAARDSPLQSPLQSPAIAPVPSSGGMRMSVDNAASTLPSPPLSTRPSMASIKRHNSLLPIEIPPLQLCEQHEDAWDTRLGHANFSIHPEPYLPENTDLSLYREFRANWDQARKSYAQHLARTMEHYGQTSKIYRLTQEKWEEIDVVWKRLDALQASQLNSQLMRLSDEMLDTPESPRSLHVLDKPCTRITIPTMDQSGKFPDIGDADIVGPLTVGPAKAAELARRSQGHERSTLKKRSFLKFLSDVLTRH